MVVNKVFDDYTYTQPSVFNRTNNFRKKKKMSTMMRDLDFLARPSLMKIKKNYKMVNITGLDLRYV